VRASLLPLLAALTLACSAAGSGDDDELGEGASTSTSTTETSTSSTSTTDASTSSDETDASTSSDETDTSSDPPDYGPDAWLPGLPDTLVPGDALLPLPSEPSGPPIWVSNNPERFFGEGWLVLHSRSDPQRGGTADPLAGSFPAYLFHINASGSTKWVHVVVTNPQAEAVEVAARGSLHTNATHPLEGPGSGPSYAVSEDWLTDSLPLQAGMQALAPASGRVLASIEVPSGGLVDGRFEIDASAGVYVYAVVTDSSAANPAIDATQGPPAPGEILSPGPNAYGREAGVYAHGEFAAALALELPAGPGHLAFAFNTAGKFAWQGVTLQEQTAAARTILADSAERTWGNYGHHYTLEFELRNTGAEPRNVELVLGSLLTAAVDQPSFTWSAPIAVGPIGDPTIVTSWTTPTQPLDSLGSWALAPGEWLPLRVEVYVPGLITAGQQLQIRAF
jgi:hypothetical protein